MASIIDAKTISKLYVGSKKRNGVSSKVINGSQKKYKIECDAVPARTRKLRHTNGKLQKQMDDQVITNFFQVKTKSALSRMVAKVNPFRASENDENACDAFTPQQLLMTSEQNEDQIDEMASDAALGCQPDYVTPKRMPISAANSFSTDDDDCHSDNSTNSTNSIQPTNIFLQKPVLHLNIDKSPNQASSIVINKHLDVCSNFAFKSLTNNSMAINESILNTANSDDFNSSAENEYESLNDETNKRKAPSPKVQGKLKRMRITKKKAATTSDNGLIDALNNSDSNSCDSGVVTDKVFESSTSNDTKPATPHRILCPTPVPVKHFKVPELLTLPNQPRTAASVRISSKATKSKTTKRRWALISYSIWMENINSYSISRLNVCKTDLLQFAVKKINESNSSDDGTACAIGEGNIKLENECLPQVESKKEQSTAVPSPQSPTPFVQKSQTQSRQMTDYYPVRRSVRKTKRAVEQEYLRQIEIAIEKQNEDDLVVKLFKDKGRGICAGRPFSRGEFVVEYIGDLIEQSEADRREKIYAKDSTFGCYMYYFKHKEQQWWYVAKKGGDESKTLSLIQSFIVTALMLRLRPGNWDDLWIIHETEIFWQKSLPTRIVRIWCWSLKKI